jgi:hypothetical protein
LAKASVAIDHVFICTAIGAPAGDRLRAFGITEGSPNQHPGQGTACRRFFFHNAMLELLWIEDPAEARSEQTRRARLWERWSGAGLEASPFGIVLQPASAECNSCPFVSWQYRPPSMPELVLDIADGVGLEEPMWCFINARRTPAGAPPKRGQPLDHPAGFHELTHVRINCPALPAACLTEELANSGVIELKTGAPHLLELHFDGGGQRKRIDFRPELPLCLRW